MLDGQMTVTSYTLGRIFPFQKEAVSQMSVTIHRYLYPNNDPVMGIQ